jgi:hypothetical protein
MTYQLNYWRLPIGFQTAPIKLMLAATSHVVATTVLLDNLRTLRTTFDLHAHELFDIDIARGRIRVCREPLMLTNEAHYRIKSQVS